MKHITTALGALALTTSLAHAGGVDRSGQSIAAIFEKGNFVELSFGRVKPSVSGTQQEDVSPPYSVTGALSGDIAADYSQFGLAVKTNVNEKVDLGLIIDQPFGANVAYPLVLNTSGAYYAARSTATLKTTAMTGILKYRTSDNLSVYGGLRYETMSAEASIPFIAGYTVKSDSSSAMGYLVGVAYEKPEIALRVALTYNSKIKHNFTLDETIDATLTTPAAALTSPTTVNSPQSVNLEMQSGVAKDTLAFASVRWVNWSAFEIAPNLYKSVTGLAGPEKALVSYDDDTITYTLGVGRKFSDTWSASIALGYEKSNGGYASNLGPTDGRTSVTVGAAYTMDKVKISGGVSYIQIGDAQTTLTDTTAAGSFTSNRAVGAGMKIAYSF
jgi:long-chain fatty acid transport protein